MSAAGVGSHTIIMKLKSRSWRLDWNNISFRINLINFYKNCQNEEEEECDAQFVNDMWR